MIGSSSARVRLLLGLTLTLLALLGSTATVHAATQLPDIRQNEPVDTLDGVETAVVQIEAVGTFVDPTDGSRQSEPGFGSGFIIDPSGIAVTNNHVVTGGALFKVFVSGRDRPVNARVLGASECFDIALIDLQGDGYPYLKWYDKPVRAGLDVYAAGFPLGDPEFTLTRGIISKAAASGESSWSSLDSVLMHDATINPGNSGGPLVAPDGSVVGVNYASDDATNQYFAIRGTDAQAILADLQAGSDVESLGINGEAMETEAGDSSVYVYSVKSGSPADQVGILPGDYILEIEGLPVGVDGVMADYCDILASHAPDDVLAVTVYRPSSDETLEGQFNGRGLAESSSIAEQIEADPTGSQLDATVDEYTYVPVSDEAGIIHLETPDAWSDIAESEWEVDGEIRGTQLVVSTDVKKFYDQWDIPGVVFSYSPDLQKDESEEELLNTLDYSDQCTLVGRSEMPADANFTGYYDEYNDCGNTNTTALVAAVIPKTEDYMLGIEVYATSEADLKALDHILDTFYIGREGEAGVTADVGDDILELVDVSGLEYDYAFVNEPYFSGVLPVDWTDVNTRDWLADDGTELGKITEVAPDIQAYRDGWNEPGMQVFLMTDIGPDFSVDDSMDAVDFSDICTYEERVPDIVHTIYGVTYSGKYDVYTNCDGGTSIYYTGVFEAGTKDHAYIIDFVSTTEADDEAFNVLLESFFLGSEVKADLNAAEYAPVQDESGRISLQAPVAWTDSESGPFEIDGETVGVEFTTSTDVNDFNDSWETPGAYVAVWDGFGETDVDEVLDTISFTDDCTYDTRYEYEGDTFAGKYDLWNDCGGVEGATFASFALTSDALADALVLLYIGTPTTQDLSILDPILNTLRIAPADDSAATATETTRAASPAVSAPVAEVGAAAPSVAIVAETLNVRSGPGTAYDIIATVKKGRNLTAVGQSGSCAWVQVEDDSGEQGWVNGAAQYIRLSDSCSELAEVAAPPLPAQAAAAPSGGSGGGQASTGQPCVTFKNQVGIEVNITLTRQPDNWNTTFTINKGDSGTRCIDAGKYTYTAATWDGRSLNDEFTVAPGEALNIDLNPG